MIKYGKLPAKLSEEASWNKLCVDLIGLYKICKKGKYILLLIAGTMIDPVTGWSEVMQYNDKTAMEIANLVETTWLIRYPCPVEITYDRGGEFLSREFKNILIEQEYGIKTKTASSRNPQANTIIERIHQVLGNIIRSFNLHDTYVDEADPWMGILAAVAFVVRAT